jgi:leucyl aminopeptidase
MKVRAEFQSILKIETDALIIGMIEESGLPGEAIALLDQALNGMLGELIAGGDLTGKAAETVTLYPRGAIPARRVIVAGLGKQAELKTESIRRAAAAAIKRARDLNARHATIALLDGLGEERINSQAVEAIVEGACLALYKYAAPKQKEEKIGEIETLAILSEKLDQAELETAVKTAEIIVDAVCLARDLVNMPANQATPTRLASAAEKIAAEHGLSLTVGDRVWAAEREMGAFLAVARGAGEPPKFIVLEHNAAKPDVDTVVLVGKGITFDTGGISIKPADKMGEMKSDMGGAAAVLAAMQVVAALNLPLRVIGITPCTENMPDANAYRPGDVITASNEKTIEIISTDAEGRLILADALVYAQQYHPKAVIDLATLTGACVIALGDGIAAGLFTNDDLLRERMVESGNRTQERVWPMPLWDDYKKAIKSDVADMKNSGGRFGGVGTSAIFLKEFVDYSWAHLDIAGMALRSSEEGYQTVGGTGFGVRLLVDLLRNWQ